MKRTPWFPLWAGFQDDENFLAVSAEAELLYLRGVGKCKQLDHGSDGGQIGRGQLRRLCDKMTGAPEAIAGELVAVGLWDETPLGWQIVAYGDWNTSADEERVARSHAGKRGNHARWRHKQPYESCTLCHPEQDGVSPGESHRSPNGIRSESERNRKPSLDGDVDETRQNTPLPPIANGSQSDRKRIAPDALLVEVALADQIIEALGIVGAHSTEGERRLIARALGRGWTDTDLLDQAHIVAGRDDIDRPRPYLLSVLTRMANTAPAGTPARATDERRPLLDDDRPDCPSCAGSGMVDVWADDGTHDGATHCPDCDPLQAAS